MSKFPKASDFPQFRLGQMPVRICGIYLLIRCDEVVYVGQSRNLLPRILMHVEGSDAVNCPKLFDSFAYIECEPSELDHLERHWIGVFDPIDNRSLTSRNCMARVLLDSKMKQRSGDYAGAEGLRNCHDFGSCNFTLRQGPTRARWRAHRSEAPQELRLG